jgi:hypothetical protein
MHNSHLIHGSVVRLAKSKYPKQATNWKFGIPTAIDWYGPDGTDPKLIVDSGLLVKPCIDGDYSEDTKAHYKDLIPSFTNEEVAMMKGTCDFIGINYYSGQNVMKTQVCI